MKIGIAKMQIIVTEIRRIVHEVCLRCGTDLTESGECICDYISKADLKALAEV